MASTVASKVEIIPPGKLSAEEQLAHLEWLDDLLDSRFVIPGTNNRFGLGGGSGMVPIAGDLISALRTFYLISKPSRLGLSSWVKLRMVWNVATHTTVGALPVI